MLSILRSFWLAVQDTTPVRKLVRLLNRLWIRIALIGVLSLLSIAVARLVSPQIPEGLNDAIGAGSVETLLQIIANSMLAVTTFSMTVVVTVYRSASGQWSPRVHRLMLDDQTMQNTLATLIGAYIYALASIILLNSAAFSQQQVVVLFFFTIFVLVLIVIAIVRWISYLQTLGSLSETAHRVEQRTLAVMEVRRLKPCLGANPLLPATHIPGYAWELRCDKSGYIEYIFDGALSEMAEKSDIDIYLTAPVGRFVFKGDTLAHVTRHDAKIETELRKNIGVGDLRTFDQDPRFGLVVLGEIASKALSPGINDPGTAIEIIGRMARVFDAFVDEISGASDPVTHSRLWAPPIDPVDMLEDGFAPIARDGAGTIEVQIALQKTLTHLARHADTRLGAAATQLAQQSFDAALPQLPSDRDRDRLRRTVPDAFLDS